MKSIQKITLSSVMASLAVAVMFAAFFPYATYSVPALSGLAIMLVFMEAGALYALGAYAVSGVLSLILCEKEAAVLFVCFFGIYPILKAYFEKVKNIVFVWIIKIIFFNLSAVVSFLAAEFVFGIGIEEGEARWLIYAFWIIYNVFFVIYDICLSKLSLLYFKRFHTIVGRILKNKK